MAANRVHIEGRYKIVAAVIVGILGLIGTRMVVVVFLPGTEQEQAAPWAGEPLPVPIAPVPMPAVPSDQGLPVLVPPEPMPLVSSEPGLDVVAPPVPEPAFTYNVPFIESEPIETMPQPPPVLERTYITMSAYFELLENPGIPHVDVARQYLGKQVEWTAYFRSLDVYPENEERRYRVVLVSDPQHFSNYLCIYFPASAEQQLSGLRKNIKVRVCGVLERVKELKDATITIDE